MGRSIRLYHFLEPHQAQMSEQTLITIALSIVTVILTQLGAGYLARLRAPSQNLKDESEATSGILESAKQLRELYQDQFKDQQLAIEGLKEANLILQKAQLDNQRRIFELEAQDRIKADKIDNLQKSDYSKTTEIENLRAELEAVYAYLEKIQAWAKENNHSLPTSTKPLKGAKGKA